MGDHPEPSRLGRPADWVDADGIHFLGSGHTFRANYIHDISMSDPLNADPHIDAFQTWDNAAGQAGKNCVFENNKIVLGDSTTGFQLEGGVSNLVIRNNIVKAFRGLSAYVNGSSPYTKPANVMVYNNLFEGDLEYKASSYPEGVTMRNTTGGIIENNMFINQRGQTIYLISSTGIVFDYNLFYNSDGSTPYGNPQPHDIWGTDPQFIDMSGADYHLNEGSPAIDTGARATSVPNDFDGNTRPSGGSYDRGVYEFQKSQTNFFYKEFIPAVAK